MEAAVPDRQRDNAVSPAPMPENLAHELDRDELSRMVREVNDAGASYQAMADRAIDTETGDQASRPYLYKLATNQVTTPPAAERLRAIARGLNKPLSVVQRAAARQFLDYRATELSGYDDDVRVIVAHLAGMSPVEKRRWRAMIEASEQVEPD